MEMGIEYGWRADLCQHEFLPKPFVGFGQRHSNEPSCLLGNTTGIGVHTEMNSRPNLILVGFMGSGKSSIGRLAAHRLRFQFVDTDSLIVDRAGMEISDIFEKSGEAHFRDLESRALESLQPLNRCVIATGGGAVLREENRALLQSLGFVVLLTAENEVLFQRVARNSKRPLLQSTDPQETIAELLVKRQPAYEATAQFTLDTSHMTHEQATNELVKAARHAFGWDHASDGATSPGTPAPSEVSSSVGAK
jgi:shikimate kinase